MRPLWPATSSAAHVHAQDWWPGGTGLKAISGWIGVPLVAFSIYGAPALLLEEGAQPAVLPLARRGRARTSLEGNLGEQIEQVESEPGIRRQL